jgi:Ca2+-binding EF-hand superfamily protein
MTQLSCAELRHIQTPQSRSDGELDLSSIPDELKVRAINIFNAYDTDHSGTIDEIELHALLKELIGPITLPESNVIYHEMDKNNSGTITFDEYPSEGSSSAPVFVFGWLLFASCS